MGRRGIRACLRGGAALVAMGAVIVPGVGASAGQGNDAGSWKVTATLGLGSGATAASCPTAAACWAVEAGKLLSSNDGGQTWADQTGLLPKEVLALDDLSCPSVGTCYLTAAGRGGAPVWLSIHNGVVATTAAPGSTRLSTVSCSGARHCMASDGKSVHVTRDGGQTWTTTSLPAFVYSNAALSCVARTRTCWIVGDNGETPVIEKTVNDGKTWEHQAAPFGLDGVYDVACPSVTSCHAVGADLQDDAMIVGTSDGSTWVEEKGPQDDYSFESVACPSVEICYAAGQSPASTPFIYTTTDGGGSWQRETVPADHLTDVPALACPTVSVCAAVSGGRAYWTTDSGATWNAVDVATTVSAPHALSCPSATDCVGVSNDAFDRPTALTTSDGGRHWARHDLDHAFARLSAVDCPTVSVCFATSNGTEALPTAFVAHGLYSTDGGSTWSEGKVATKAAYLRYLTCPTTTTCIAGGYDRHSATTLRLTTDGGHTWKPIPAPPSAFELGGISCASVTSCSIITTVISGSTQAFTTSDLGQSYQPATINADNYYTELSCVATTCVAGGFDSGDGALSISRDEGVSWKDVTLPNGVQMIENVSCSTKAVCVTTSSDFGDGGGPMLIGTTDRGRSWHDVVLAERHRNPFDLSCFATRCLLSGETRLGNPEILAGPA